MAKLPVCPPSLPVSPTPSLCSFPSTSPPLSLQEPSSVPPEQDTPILASCQPLLQLPPLLSRCCPKSLRHGASASAESDFLKLKMLEELPSLWHQVDGPVTEGGAGTQATGQSHFFLVALHRPQGQGQEPPSSTDFYFTHTSTDSSTITTRSPVTSPALAAPIRLAQAGRWDHHKAS